jgi:hypothetical protein
MRTPAAFAASHGITPAVLRPLADSNTDQIAA